MGIETKTFSNYALKKEFGQKFTEYGTKGTRIYRINNSYLMFEPINNL